MATNVKATSRPDKTGGPLDSPRFPNTLTTEDTQETDSFLTAGIFEWIKDPKATAFKIGEVIAKEAKETETDIKEFVRYLKILEDPLPAYSFIGYLADSAKARIKAGLNPTQAEVDAQRTFTPESLMTAQHMETLDFFVRKAKNDWKGGPKDKDSNWNSLNLLDKKYEPLLDQDPKLRAMAWTLGKVSFKQDPKTNTITYADRYDFDKKEAAKTKGIVGPSKAPEFTWGIGRPFPKGTKAPKITEI